jgi:HBS1 N-terminus
MQNILGDSVPESVMIKAAMECKFDLEHALDQLLNKTGKLILLVAVLT